MLPFLPSFPNQKQAPGGNEPARPQFVNSSSALQNQSGFNNSPFFLPTVGSFPNPNAVLGSLLTQQHLMQGLQNSIIGALSHQQPFQCNPHIMPQFHGQQLNLLGGLQSSNFLNLQQSGLLGGPPLGQNLNQMMGLLSNRPLCSQNHQSVMGSNNPKPRFLPNNTPQAAQNKNNMTGLEGQPTNQKSIEPSLPGSLASNYSGGRKWSQPQMVPRHAGGKNFSNNSDNLANKTPKSNFHGFGKRQQISGSFKKSEAYKPRNSWQKAREFHRNDRSGNHNRKDRHPNFSESSANSTTMQKRPLAVMYSESEIQQWREARKRNFPTKAKIEKKQRHSIAREAHMDSDAEVRRQQLKEVLAKQAELGVEVAEIPSSYLTTQEEQTSARGCNKRSRVRRNSKHAKKLKGTDAAPPGREPLVQKREPTLLRKLLNADIRRDRSQLLQAFRFMVLNSFFRDVQDKPLVFPLISAKDAAPRPEIVVQDSPTQDVVVSNASFKGKNSENSVESGSLHDPSVLENSEDEFDKSGRDVEVSCEQLDEDLLMGGEKSEEGEITE